MPPRTGPLLIRLGKQYVILEFFQTSAQFFEFLPEHGAIVAGANTIQKYDLQIKTERSSR